MKKKSFFINNEKGFFFPYVMFITLLFFIIFIASVNIYKNEAKITNNMIEQQEIESLFQMGLAKFKIDYSKFEHELEIPVIYHFPTGTVKITYLYDDEYIYLSYEIITINGTVSQTINNLIKKEHIIVH